MKGRIATVLILLLAATEHVFAQDAVVGIYSDLGSSEGQGTGFFYSSSGDILTAYHVIEGARSLEIFHQGHRYKDHQIIVESVDPNTDLAHLRITNLPRSPRYYPLATQATQWASGQQLNSIGYLRGIPNQHLKGYFTQQGRLMSAQVRDKKGNRLFAHKTVELLPVYMDGIYSGASGGPILLHNRVVGILSGSYDEGGSFTWGIPVDYMRDMQKIGRRASQISKWPRFSLMNQRYWRNLRASLEVNYELAEKLDRYFTLLDSVSYSHENLFVKADAARGALGLSIQAMISVENEINQSTTKEVMRKRLEPILQGGLLPSLEDFKNAGIRFDEQSSKLKYALQGLLRHIINLRNGLPRTEHNLNNILETDPTVRSLSAKFDAFHAGQRKFTNEMADSISQLSVAQGAGNAVDHKDLRNSLRSYRSALQRIDGILNKYTASEQLREFDKSLSLWQELGELCERLAYQTWEHGEQFYRYSSNRAAYSIVMPSGWVPETPGLLKSFSNVTARDPTTDLKFLRTGHFGDQLKGPGFDGITTIPGPQLQLSDLSDIMAQSDMLRTTYADLFHNFRDFRMVQRQIAGYDGILITGKFGTTEKVGKIHYAFINTTDLSLWVHCTIHSGASVDDCVSTIDSLSFGN